METYIKKIAELLHNAGLNAHTHPQSQSAEEWNQYRVKIAKGLYDSGVRIAYPSDSDPGS